MTKNLQALRMTNEKQATARTRTEADSSASPRNDKKFTGSQDDERKTNKRKDKGMIFQL
jgi:hypothetical protein